MKKILFILFTLSLSLNANAVIELDLDFNYSKSVFGAERQNKTTSRVYGGSMAFYFFDLTAIEFNYSESEKETIVNHNTKLITTGLVIDTETSTLLSKSYGVGIRQALSGRGSFIIPVISIGWARQRFEDSATATLLDKDTSSSTIYKSGVSTFEYDSVFGSFALKLRFTKTLSLKGSVKTSFRAFEWNEAKDQLSYAAGLSWMF